MSLLPVYEVIEPILNALKNSQQVLLHAPAGAGKSTGLPLELLKKADFPGRIIMLEPRRIAARSVANRLATQLNENIGQTVGYRMRSETKVSTATRLEVVTEGILTRMLQQDPMLEGVSLVILDEFHERSLQADLALALLLDVQAGLRDDLRILIMSATLDNQRLSALLPDAPVIISEGCSFPVTRNYHPLPAHQPFEQSVATTVLRLLQQQQGSLLLFLPGIGEIQRVLGFLHGKVAEDTALCPLYGALSLAEQQKAIEPSPLGRRKVVLATNIAETSLTIEGIRLVVDSGLERTTRFEPKTGLTRLITQRISQASMTQRAGRAGRLEAGICWHLFSQEQAERAAEHSEPEILNADLGSLWLSLLQWGCHDTSQLHWLDKPPTVALAVAKSLLLQLGAVNHNGQLTSRGRKMAESGSDLRLAAMLCAGSEQGADTLATAAMLTAILEEPPRDVQPDITYWVEQRQTQWLRRAKQLVSNIGGHFGEPACGAVAMLLAQSFPDRIAKNRDKHGRFQLANGLGAMIDDKEKLSDESWLVAPSLLQSSKNPDARILLACSLDIEQLAQQQPGLFSEQSIVEWDDNKGTLKAWKKLQCGNLTVKAQLLAKPSDEQLQQALLNWLRSEGLHELNWSSAAVQLCTRIQCAAQWLPEIQWPEVDNDSLMASLERWLMPFLTNVHDLKGLKQIDLLPALESLLDWQQRQCLDNELPVYYTVATGSRIAIRYFSDKPPVLSVTMQEMYGEQQSPSLAKGRVTLVLELLSPAQRPLQITQDLAAFWQGSYREVQKEMKGRYPKHLWPDDPANTAPTRRVKKYSQ
ncbi:ATP-dependent helicase HrpB [Photorhabdus cinerea]|uniref:ATP-dependent helicase HrpB n=1 Tax=Photorhabdus cinerea TaxID=471575 RepID=A0A7X5QH29_9GAMM|nr:ATP-dependent helicase HrpB [Photorhabdus cinerea]